MTNATNEPDKNKPTINHDKEDQSSSKRERSETDDDK